MVAWSCIKQLPVQPPLSTSISSCPRGGTVCFHWLHRQFSVILAYRHRSRREIFMDFIIGSASTINRATGRCIKPPARSITLTARSQSRNPLTRCHISADRSHWCRYKMFIVALALKDVVSPLDYRPVSIPCSLMDGCHGASSTDPMPFCFHPIRHHERLLPFLALLMVVHNLPENVRR